MFYKTIDTESRETHLNMTGNEHGVWYVMSDDPYWIRRLDKVAEFVRETGQGREYKLKASQVTIRGERQKRELTDEQREIIRERFAKSRTVTK